MKPFIAPSLKGSHAAGRTALLAIALAMTVSGTALAEGDASPAGKEAAPAEKALTAEQQQPVLDLAATFKGSAGEIVQDHMANVDDPPSKFPFDRMKDVAALSPAQLHLLLRTLGKDQSIGVPNRSIMTGTLADAWMKRPENKDPKEVRPILDCLFEFASTLGPSWDALPLTGSMQECVDWNAEATADFIVAHWKDWPKTPNGCGIIQVKNMALAYLRDPQQRARLEAIQEPAGH